MSNFRKIKLSTSEVRLSQNDTNSVFGKIMDNYFKLLVFGVLFSIKKVNQKNFSFLE